MTTKQIFFVALSIFNLNTSLAQITFQKTYGGTNEYAYSVQQTTDGGYIIAGMTSSYGSGSYDVYLIKTDSIGDTLWTKTFGGTSADRAYSVQQTSDSGYIITGTTQSFGAGFIDVYLIKTNANGNALWTKTFGATNWDEGRSVQQTNDGGYIIGGTINWNAGPDIYLIKADSMGDTLWTKTIGLGSNSEMGYQVQQISDSGFIIIGRTGIGSNVNVYLIKTDITGNILWSKTFGGYENDFGYSIQQTSDGGYIIGGTSLSFSLIYSYYLIKTNSTGIPLWEKVYDVGDNAYCQSVRQTADGGFILVGNTYFTNISTGTDYRKIFLIKTNANGDTMWSKRFESDLNNMGNSVQQTSDGGFIIAGAKHFNSGSWNAYLIKTDVNGNSGCNESNPTLSVISPLLGSLNPATVITSLANSTTTPATMISNGGIITTLCSAIGIPYILNPESSISIFPNPFTNELKLTNTKENGEILLYDLMGKEILRERTLPEKTNFNTTKIAKGFYILHYIEGSKIETMKLIKM